MIPGVILQGVAAIAEILGWPLEATRMIVQELVEAGEILLDARARLIFVPRALDVSQPENPNVITSWAMTWHEVPDCDLKQDIWNALEASIRPRGDSFIQAFHAACPSPGGKGLWDGFGNGSPNRRENKEQEQEQDQEKDQEQEHDPDLGRPGAPSEGRGGFSSGGVNQPIPGVVPGSGVGPGSASGPGSSFVLGSGPRSDPGEDPGADRRSQAPPSRFDERTLDDIDDDHPVSPRPVIPSVTSPEGSVPVPDENPDAALAIIRAWNEQVASKGGPFEAVEGPAVERLLPHIRAALRHPGAAEDFTDLFRIIPVDPFYAGDNPKAFVAFLAHYARQSFSDRHKAAEIARKKLHRVSSKKATSRSEVEAALARKRASASAGGLLHPITNNLDSRINSGK